MPGSSRGASCWVRYRPLACILYARFWIQSPPRFSCPFKTPISLHFIFRLRCVWTVLSKSPKLSVSPNVRRHDSPSLKGYFLLGMTDRLALPSSLLLGVPLPEAYHAAGDAIQVAVDQAIRESEENGMSKSGKGATPWLLERVGQLTKGVAIISSWSFPPLFCQKVPNPCSNLDMALIRNNVKVGGEIALAYASLLKQEV